MSGRLNFDDNGTPLFLQEQIPLDDKTSYYNALKYQHQPTHLSNAYFSSENIDKIHNLIKKSVFNLSNGKYTIDNQNKDTLKTIMKSIYLQSSKFKQENIEKQINELNDKVIDYSSNNILNEIESYMKFRKDSSTMHVPLSVPTYLHNDNTLELKRFF